MLAERLLSTVVRGCTDQYLKLEPVTQDRIPGPVPGQRYMLYMHVPFCERLCPYCSFNRFPFAEDRARPYFANMRREMLMLKDLGYDFDSVYIGGGTPTIMLDELCETIDLARGRRRRRACGPGPWPCSGPCPRSRRRAGCTRVPAGTPR